MERDDCPKPGLSIEEVVHALVPGEGGFVEHMRLRTRERCDCGGV
jgi:hypothetical protein